MFYYSGFVIGCTGMLLELSTPLSVLLLSYHSVNFLLFFCKSNLYHRLRLRLLPRNIFKALYTRHKYVFHWHDNYIKFLSFVGSWRKGTWALLYSYVTVYSEESEQPPQHLPTMERWLIVRRTNNTTTHERVLTSPGNAPSLL